MQTTAEFWIALARILFEIALYLGVLKAMSRAQRAERDGDDWRRRYLDEHEEVKRLLRGGNPAP